MWEIFILSPIVTPYLIAEYFLIRNPSAPKTSSPASPELLTHLLQSMLEALQDDVEGFGLEHGEDVMVVLQCQHPNDRARN